MELKEFGILEKTIYGIGLKKLGILKTIIYGSIPYVYPLHLNYPPSPSNIMFTKFSQGLKQ